MTRPDHLPDLTLVDDAPHTPGVYGSYPWKHYHHHKLPSIDAAHAADADGAWWDIEAMHHAYITDGYQSKVDETDEVEYVRRVMRRQLSYRQYAILCLMLGLDGDPVPTLREAGLRFKVSRERVRQIWLHALRRLKYNAELRSYAIKRAAR